MGPQTCHSALAWRVPATLRDLRHSGITRTGDVRSICGESGNFRDGFGRGPSQLRLPSSRRIGAGTCAGLSIGLTHRQGHFVAAAVPVRVGPALRLSGARVRPCRFRLLLPPGGVGRGESSVSSPESRWDRRSVWFCSHGRTITPGHPVPLRVQTFGEGCTHADGVDGSERLLVV